MNIEKSEVRRDGQIAVRSQFTPRGAVSNHSAMAGAHRGGTRRRSGIRSTRWPRPVSSRSTGKVTSTVHDYGDIEGHAFILGIVSEDRWDEVQTKSYLTYASHWIDDFIDCPDRVAHPAQLMEDRHDIRNALANMGPVGQVGFAMANRVPHPEAIYKTLHRMLYGGLVQRSKSYAERHALVTRVSGRRDALRRSRHRQGNPRVAARGILGEQQERAGDLRTRPKRSSTSPPRSCGTWCTRRRCITRMRMRKARAAN